MSLTPNLTQKPITLPFQAGLKMKFRAPGLVYIKSITLSIEEEKGSMVVDSTWVVGPDWDSGYAYRVLYNITKAGDGGTGSYEALVDKYDWLGEVSTSVRTDLNWMMQGAGFVKGTASTYNIQADFQAKASEGANWQTTGNIKTIQTTW